MTKFEIITQQNSCYVSDPKQETKTLAENTEYRCTRKLAAVVQSLIQVVLNFTDLNH
jgi:hypothetical protein